MNLTPKQAEAVQAAVDSLHEPASARIASMATGTGKTATGSEIVARMAQQGKLGLWTVDRRNLVNQAVTEIGRHQPQLHISVEMGSIRSGGLRLSNLIVGTIQSISGRTDQIPKPDYIIVDEAHQDITNGEYHRLYEYYKEVPRLGLTATPFDGKGNDIIQYGKWKGYVIQYSLLDAITDGYLCPIRAHVTHVDNIDLSKVDYNKDQLSKKDLQIVEDQILQEEVLHKMALAIIEMPTPCIVFCPSTKVSRALSEVVNRYDPESTMHIDCYMDEHLDGTALSEFRSGKRKRVCNYRLWTYGIDVPNCRSVVFCCDKNRVSYMQGIGRVSRWCCSSMIFSRGIDCSCGEKKTEGHVLDFADNISSHSQASMWSTLSPTATREQWEAMDKEQTDHPEKTAAEIVQDILDRPMIARAEAVIDIEEVDISNPMANLVDRSRLIGFAVPVKDENNASRCSRSQIERIKDAFFYSHETKLQNSSWVAELTHSQARELLQTIEARKRAGLADPKLLLQLSRIKRGKERLFDRTVLQTMTEERAQFHWEKHRHWLKGKKS